MRATGACLSAGVWSRADELDGAADAVEGATGASAERGQRHHHDHRRQGEHYASFGHALADLTSAAVH
jgi:hypothetical protein